MVAALAQEMSWQGDDNSGRYRITLVTARSPERWLLASVHIGPLQIPRPARVRVGDGRERGRSDEPAVWGLPGDDDSGVLAALPTVESLIARMDALLVQLRDQQDPRRFFHATYLRTTRAVGTELAAGGFLDAAWVQRWDVVFAGFYLDALEAHRRDGPVPGPWAVAFGAGAAVPPLRHVLLGMNAHINYDLPQALLAVISDAEFGDAALLARREADHRHIDRVLAAVVERAATVPETAGRRNLPDRLLGPANRLAAKRFLVEARAKVWGNARMLARARRQGEAAYRPSAPNSSG